jgi:hypothetical protein
MHVEIVIAGGDHEREQKKESENKNRNCTIQRSTLFPATTPQNKGPDISRNPVRPAPH